MSELAYSFGLHAKQLLAYRSRATEILYGGAKGGGKSFLIRVCAIVWCVAIPGIQVYLFRRNYKELVKSHVHGKNKFPDMIRPLGRLAEIVADRVRFFNGSTIHLCHCQHEDDVRLYAGNEINVLMIDQLEEFSEQMYQALRGEVRMAGLEVPANLAGLFPRILCSDNPGGIGDGWIMQAWRLNAGEQSRDPGPIFQGDAGLSRQFVPALLEDNPELVKSDPAYAQRLEASGREEVVRAKRWGVRGLISGAFFSDVWNRPDFQILPPFNVPPAWRRFASFDWGSAKPASLGVWAVSDGNVVEVEGREMIFPSGSLIRVDELYTVVRHGNQIEHNVGQRIENRELGRQVGKKLDPWNASPIYADPQIFISQGGPTIAAQMAEGASEAAGNGGGVSHLHFERADNERIPGWQVMRRMMKSSAAETPEDPGMWVVSSCIDFLRTVPTCQIDPARGGEDLKKQGEDHVADEVRYAAMSYGTGSIYW